MESELTREKYDEEEGEGDTDQPFNIHTDEGKTSEVRSGDDLGRE